MNPGIYQGIPASTYHELPLVSNSYLKRLAKCPATAKTPQDETAALLFGRAVHTLTLEGDDAFSSEFAVLPKIDRRTKEGKAIAAEFEAVNYGKQVITADDFETASAMRESVRNHPFAKVLLAKGWSENTVIFDKKINGETIRCKCRPDRTPSPNTKCLIDLKSTEDAGYDAFVRSCIKYGYATQAAFYIDGYNTVSGDEYPEVTAFVFIAIEKKPPYRCEVYTMDMEFLMWGRREYERLMLIELQCRKANHWPHYQNAGADDLLKPAWLAG